MALKHSPLDTPALSLGLPQAETEPVVSDTAGPTPFIDGLALTYPQVAYSRYFGQRLGKVWDALKGDIQESENKIATAGIAGAVASSQVADRFRLAVAFIPDATIEVMDRTNNSLAAGGTAGALFLAWGIGLGELLRRGLEEFPKTMEATNEQFPAAVTTATNSLPGMRAAKPATGETAELALGTSNQKAKSLAKRFGSNAFLHLRRAGAGIGIGTTAFVATAAVSGQSKADIRKTYAKVAADSSVLVAGVATGVTESIKQLALNGHYELAQDIESVAGNKWTWYGVAAALMVAEYFSNKRADAAGVEPESATQGAELLEAEKT